MAFTINSAAHEIDTREWYTDLFRGVESLNYMRPLVGVKTTTNIPNIVQTSGLQVDGCDWAASGATTIDEKSISVCDLKVNQELCKTDLEVTFVSEFMRPGALNSDIPQTELDFILDTERKAIAADLEQIIWQGNLTGTGVNRLCQGLINKLDVDGGFISQTGVTVTSANVVAEFDKVFDAAIADADGERLFDPGVRENVVLIVTPAIAFAYQQAQGSLGNNTPVGEKELNYAGYRVVVAPGLPANTMILTYTDNLWWATDLAEDWETLRVIDMTDNDGSDNIRVKGRMKFGVDFAHSKYIVKYAV